MARSTVPKSARTVARRLRDAAAAPMARRTIESRLVWILGSPRSGSTWLYGLLDAHPGVVGVDEPVIGTYLGPFLSDSPGWDATALDVSNFTHRRAHPRAHNQFFAEEFADDWLPALGALMRRRFYSHTVRYPARAARHRAIVAIKEPNGSQSADIIMRSLPRSRLLFLLRDGRDVIDSQLAANSRDSWLARSVPGMRGLEDGERLGFVEQNACKWLWRTEVVQEAYAQHQGPKLTLRYEDLRADALGGMRRLLRWLELDYDEAWLRALVERRSFERVPAAKKGEGAFVRAATPGLWRQNLRSEEQDAVERILGAKLRELGYD